MMKPVFLKLYVEYALFVFMVDISALTSYLIFEGEFFNDNRASVLFYFEVSCMMDWMHFEGWLLLQTSLYFIILACGLTISISSGLVRVSFFQVEPLYDVCK